MHEATSVLFGLDGFRVIDVERVDDDLLRVVVETIDRHGSCPDCGQVSSRVKQRPRVRIRDLPVGDSRVDLWWRKRRLVCANPQCGRGSFTQAMPQVPPRSRLTNRLRAKVASAIAASNRAVAEVAGEYRIAWHTAHRALIATAARWLPEPQPTHVLGIDETRARSVRWILEAQRWRRSDPWMTSFVDADTSRPGILLGLAPGRSGACVTSWLAEQTHTFRDAIRTVVIDPSAPYASGIRAALPGVQIAVDHWHLVRLAGDMLTEVRQRVSLERHSRRGRKTDPAWAHRRMLLTAGDRLTRRQLHRLQRVLAADDPTDEIGAAWGCKELLRQMLAEHDPARIRQRLWRFYTACAEADMPETTRLANSIETWWPHILVALTKQVTNARTEGYNRTIKQVKRVACGFRNMDNYRRRIMAHIAVTRPRLQTA